MKEDKNKKAQESSQVDAKNSNIDLKDFKTLEDYINFIKNNNILSLNDIIRRFGSVYYRLKKSEYYDDVLYYFHPVIPSRMSLNTLSDFQSFIDTNNVTNMSNLYDRFPGIYRKLRKRSDFNEIVFPPSPLDLDYLDTVEKIQAFIDDHDVNNAAEFKNKFPREYRKARRLKVKLVYKNPKKHSLENFKEEKDFVDFIKQHNIKSPNELQKRFKTVADKYYKVKAQGKITNDIFPEHRVPYGDRFSTVEDFQALIDENDIKCPREFEALNSALYKRLTSLGFCSKVKYTGTRKTSVGEILINKLLLGLGLDFVFDRPAEFIENNCRLDFIIEKYKIAIEYQGAQHFKSTPYFCVDLNDQIEKDRLKYKNCKDAGYTVLYAAFTELDPGNYRQIDFEHLEYFDKIYFSLDELKTRILEIIDEYNKAHPEQTNNNPQDNQEGIED